MKLSGHTPASAFLHLHPPPPPVFRRRAASLFVFLLHTPTPFSQNPEQSLPSPGEDRLTISRRVSFGGLGGSVSLGCLTLFVRLTLHIVVFFLFVFKVESSDQQYAATGEGKDVNQTPHPRKQGGLGALQHPYYPPLACHTFFLAMFMCATRFTLRGCARKKSPCLILAEGRKTNSQQSQLHF